MSMMKLVSLLSSSGMPFGERASVALTICVIGMVMVFSVLALIMIILMIMERIFAAKKESPKKEMAAPAPAPAPVPVVEAVEDDGAIVAAITAAISAVLAAENGQETYQGGFRVVSFKRSNRGTPWNSVK